MRRILQKLFAVTALAAGLAMVGWGWHEFKNVERTPPPPSNEDAVRFEPPTIGEMIDIGPLGLKIGCMAVVVVGIAIASRSASSLVQKREHP